MENTDKKLQLNLWTIQVIIKINSYTITLFYFGEEYLSDYTTPTKRKLILFDM